MSSLPISALLSQLFVACTIEFDNAAELRMPHVTTRHASAQQRGPWLVSMAMWLNCMQFLPEKGLTWRELREQALTETNLHGMERWGYITVSAPDGQPAARSPRQDSVLRPTHWGRTAQHIWQETAAELQERWQQRFGAELLLLLREIADALPFAMPDCMPILHYGLWTFDPARKRDWEKQFALPRPSERRNSGFLPVVLARILLHFAAEYESASHLSLAMAANVLRVLSEEGVLLRDLPRRSGVSKEAIAMGLGVLEKRGLMETEGSARTQRSKAVMLTERGALAVTEYAHLVRTIENRWKQRLGAERLDKLRTALEALVKCGHGERAPIFAHLVPAAENWRSRIAAPECLPHYPMVLHRGGYPDGS
uniref:MarR family transcriptional regulator n=1 Tax=Acidobacterium capsulatum TaxID=33075 RepID=A0A7V4XUG0_9BACT